MTAGRNKRGAAFISRINLGRDLATGKRVKEFRSFRTKAERDVYRAQRLLERQAHPGVVPRTLTAGQLLHQWLDGRRLKGLSGHTLDDYESAIRVHLLPEFSTCPVSRLTSSAIESYLARKIGEHGHLRRSVEAAINVLAFALRWADRRDLLGRRNPMDRIERPRRERNQKALPWDFEDVQLFLGAARTHSPYPVLYAMAMTSGLRQGELLSLTWRDVDLVAETVTVRQQLRRRNGHGVCVAPPKTRASLRPVPLHPRVVQELFAIRETQDEAKRALGPRYHDRDLVFCQPNGKPLWAGNITNRDLPRVIKAAGVQPIEFRKFRNVFLTYYANPMGGGASLRDAQGIAGHSSARTTQEVYVQPVLDSQRDAIRRLGDRWLIGDNLDRREDLEK